MRLQLRGLALALVLPVLGARGTEQEPEVPDPAETAMLTVRAQARQVLDANEVLDGLEKLSRYPEAARVLLSQNQDPALMEALQAMHRSLAPPPAKPAVVQTKPARLLPPAKRRIPTLRVVGAWAAPVPKAIILAGGYHIVYVGDSFKVSSTTYTLRTITPLDSPEATGERRYRLELTDSRGALTRLDWPNS